jgi:hypothetical protein
MSYFANFLITILLDHLIPARVAYFNKIHDKYTDNIAICDEDRHDIATSNGSVHGGGIGDENTLSIPTQKPTPYIFGRKSWKSIRCGSDVAFIAVPQSSRLKNGKRNLSDVCLLIDRSLLMCQRSNCEACGLAVTFFDEQRMVQSL